MEVVPIGSLLPADELHQLFETLVLVGTLAKLLDLRGGESTLSQWVSETRGSGSVMGLSAGKDVVFEEVKGKVALFWVSPPLSTTLVCFHRFIPHWVRQLQWVYGYSSNFLSRVGIY